jgi:hypothetical protein
MSDLILILILVLNSGGLLLLLVFQRSAAKMYFSRRDDYGSKKVKDKLLKKLERELSAKMDVVLKDYATLLNGQSRTYFAKMEDQILAESKKLAVFIEEQEKRMVTETEYLVASDFAKVKAELSEFKKKRLAEINEKINLITKDASKEALGKSIDVATHEEIVQNAIEAAKLDNMFFEKK